MEYDAVFILSTGRAGSTSLYSAFKDVIPSLPENKEPHFFIDLKKYSQVSEGAHKYNISDFSKYKSLYHSSNIIVDASCGYFFYASEFIENVRQCLDFEKTLVIILLRDPVTRNRSMMREISNKNFSVDESSETRVWWEHMTEDIPYVSSCESILANFKNVMIIDYDHFRVAPKDIFSRILAVCSIGDTDTDTDFPKKNSSEEIILKKFSIFLKNILPDCSLGILSWLNKNFRHIMLRLIGLYFNVHRVLRKQRLASVAEIEGFETIKRRYLSEGLFWRMENIHL